jgi:hypothetical protein
MIAEPRLQSWSRKDTKANAPILSNPEHMRITQEIHKPEVSSLTDLSLPGER